MLQFSRFIRARKTRRLVSVLLFCLTLFARSNALAGAPEPPVLEIWKAGDVTVTAIQDLPGAMPAGIFRGPASEEAKKPFFPGGTAEAGFNVFLMRAGGKTVLFDSGNGSAAKTPGRLLELLAGLGVKPEDVDLVLLTHLHMDHAGGLMKDGGRAFPKARLAVARPEIEYWLGLAKSDAANANGALVKAIAEAYGGDLLPPFSFGGAPLPGVTALDAVGHTPGHTAFQVEAGGKTLLIIGDVIHGSPLQFALPDECAVYDADMPAAIASRKRILNLAAERKMPVAGMHLPFPGDGTVVKDGQAYKLEK